LDHLLAILVYQWSDPKVPYQALVIRESAILFLGFTPWGRKAFSAREPGAAESTPLTNLQHQNSSGGILANYTYTFDQASRMTSQTVNGSTTSYSYHAASELTADGATNYTHDHNGNAATSPAALTFVAIDIPPTSVRPFLALTRLLA
jgi:hypothetical protein